MCVNYLEDEPEERLSQELLILIRDWECDGEPKPLDKMVNIFFRNANLVSCTKS